MPQFKRERLNVRIIFITQEYSTYNAIYRWKSIKKYIKVIYRSVFVNIHENSKKLLERRKLSVQNVDMIIDLKHITKKNQYFLYYKSRC